MGSLFDLIILIVIALSLFNGWRLGLVKSVMNFASAILSFFAAVFFTPYAGPFICDTFIKGALSSEVNETLSSLLASKTGGGTRTTAELFSEMPSSLSSMFDRFGVDRAAIEAKYSSTAPATEAVVGEISDAIVTPVAEMISAALAFILIFVLVSVILKVVTFVIGKTFELPVLKQFNELAGLGFGAVSAIFYAIVLSTVFIHLAGTLAVFDPETFSDGIIEDTYLVRLFSGLRLSMVTDLLSKVQ